MRTILSVAFPFAAVGDGAVGGAEVVLTTLERELVARGWGSVVVARAGSVPAGELVGTEVPEGVITDEVREVVTARHQAGIDRALARGGVDLVHMHGIDFANYRVPAGVPVLVTLHLPPGWYPEGIWGARPGVRMVCVSEAQRRSCPEGVREALGVVGNGVAVEEKGEKEEEEQVPFGNREQKGESKKQVPYGNDNQNGEGNDERGGRGDFTASAVGGLRPTHGGGAAMNGAPGLRWLVEESRDGGGGYAVMLSRICPEKNLHAGLDAARLAGVEVVLAGETFPYEAHLRYFEEEIRPRLGAGGGSGTAARLMGAVGGVEKGRLLRGARCLLLPTMAPETSSLVAMEAAACGTPVVAYRSGAVPEVVEDGVTGFLVDGLEEMARAIGRVGEIDRQVCRRVARERFSLGRMVDGYLAVYEEMLAAGGVDGRASAGAGVREWAG